MKVTHFDSQQDRHVQLLMQKKLSKRTSHGIEGQSRG